MTGVQTCALPIYLIDTYSNLQRIKEADDSLRELDYQLKIVRAKLESFGIVTENLDMNK